MHKVSEVLGKASQLMERTVVSCLSRRGMSFSQVFDVVLPSVGSSEVMVLSAGCGTYELKIPENDNMTYQDQQCPEFRPPCCSNM
jgi:hypothetical protein